MDEELISAAKQNSEIEMRERREEAMRAKERQQAKKKYFWLVEKKLAFQQNMMEEAAIYEKQIQDFHKKIEMLRKNEEDLKNRE